MANAMADDQMMPVDHGVGSRWKLPGRSLAGVALSWSLLTSCSGGGAAGPDVPTKPVAQPTVLTTLTITVTASSIQPGQSATAVATGFDQNGAGMSIGVPAWTSDQPAIARVNANGVVTAVTPGQTSVIGRIGDVQGQAIVIVTALPPGPTPIVAVSVHPNAASIDIGQTVQLNVTSTNAAGDTVTGRAVAWATNAAGVATVSSTGLVTALAEGTAIIEATSEGQTGALALTVTTATDSNIIVTIAIPAGIIPVGDTLSVVATARSPFPIVSVGATAGGQQLALIYSLVGPSGHQVPAWIGTMNLASLRFGQYDLVVTATDSRGHHGVTSVTFERNPRVAGGGKVPTPNKQRVIPLPHTIKKPDGFAPA